MRDIFRSIPNYSELTGQDRRKLHEDTLMYAFRFINYRQYMAEMKSVMPKDVPVPVIQEWVRVNVLENAYLMHNVKHWLYNAVCLGDDPMDVAHKYGIQDYDLRVGYLIEKGEILHLKLKTICSKPRPIEKTERIINKVIESNMDYLWRLVHKKLRFVSTYQVIAPNELVNDLMCRGLRALRHEWPNYPSVEYMHNLFRCSAQNEGKNIIDRATAKKNARLISIKDGFQTVTVSWEQMLETTQEIADYAMSSMTDWQRSVDLHLDVRSLCEGVKWQEKLVAALSGYEASLSAWLEQRQITDDNEELLRSLGLQDYLETIAGWLGVPIPAIRHFIRDMKNTLKPWKTSLA